ncbi:MAG: leucine-rich repeat domain-containing protein [Ruminococcus sp.]|nr:leucine-rich repeat domain-containing protein [Ruminococcus sp.]
MIFTFISPNIYFPEKSYCVSYLVPEIELSSEQAVSCGYSFRKKDYSVKITNYHGKSAKKLVIPYKIDGMTVDEICDKAFENVNVTELYIHGGLKKIGKYTFHNSTVKKVVIADGIKRISERMFSECKNLVEINIPLTVKSIGKSAFANCASLKFIAFPQSIRDIDDFVFNGSGLKKFALETERNFLLNRKIFYGSPIANKYDVICTSFEGSPLRVLYVKSGCVTFNAQNVTFLPNSLIYASRINLESCEKIHFYRNAFDDHRDNYGIRMFSMDQIVILPEGYGVKYGYYFPDYVTVKNYYYKYAGKQPSPYTVNTTNDTATVEVITSYMPSWTLKLPYRHIKICTSYGNIEKYAIDCNKAETVEIDYLNAEGEIFSLYCHNLHKVTWNDDNCKYIPPSSLIGYILHKELLKAFSPVSAQINGRYKRYFFNRELIDNIFTSKYFEYKDYYNRTQKIRVGNRKKVLIAIDVLRSTHLEHEKSTEMYSNFLMNHQKYAHDVCESIEDEYPDYAETLKVL